MAGTDLNFSINSEQFSNYISFYKELVPDGEMLTGGCVCISFLFSVNIVLIITNFHRLTCLAND